ncbi:hypothetical protein [Hymenobacter jejuensis]|uniref:Uncharacterized protein n=1 Tax=Hymenobacter jejuensis TaxID=2502781 RepID=A0A5B7ZYA1_9BACT|nr:hypothetical protein [Hymenobacter jejuensis]QDA60181.1 hypothetical protein FHG12_08700 [Hymenobacter jejuensis]
MRSFWLVAGWGLLITACGSDEQAQPQQTAAHSTQYFDVKGFLDAQAQLLNRQNPAVEKKVNLRDGKLETTRVPHVDWTKELQIFYQADINKPALRGAYAIESAPTNGQRAYVRKPGIENTVENLTVTADGDQVRELTARLVQNNPLFYSEKKLYLHTTNGVLSDYRVEGLQKLVMFDTLRYSAAMHIIK